MKSVLAISIITLFIGCKNQDAENETQHTQKTNTQTETTKQDQYKDQSNSIEIKYIYAIVQMKEYALKIGQDNLPYSSEIQNTYASNVVEIKAYDENKKYQF